MLQKIYISCKSNAPYISNDWMLCPASGLKRKPLYDQVEVSSIIFLNRYAVPETPFSVPVKVGSQELNELISSLLSSNGMYRYRLG